MEAQTNEKARRKGAEPNRGYRIDQVGQHELPTFAIFPNILCLRLIQFDQPNKTTLFCMIIVLELGYNAATLSGVASFTQEISTGKIERRIKESRGGIRVRLGTAFFLGDYVYDKDG